MPCRASDAADSATSHVSTAGAADLVGMILEISSACIHIFFVVGPTPTTCTSPPLRRLGFVAATFFSGPSLS